jgi:hypothetical protein
VVTVHSVSSQQQNGAGSASPEAAKQNGVTSFGRVDSDLGGISRVHEYEMALLSTPPRAVESRKFIEEPHPAGPISPESVKVSTLFHRYHVP